LFLNGALSYVSALLWFAFLVASTVEAALNAIRPPDYFPDGRSLFPAWPVWRPDWAIALLAVTAMILFLPKLLAIVLVVLRRETRAFGGLARLIPSVLAEIGLSSLFAPIRMVFHTKFVAMNLLGRTVVWRSGKREDSETSWGEALRHHGLDTALASAWGTALFVLNPHYFFWIMPVIGALVLSVPISVLVSRVRIGDRARRAGFFVIPEESDPAPELRDLEAEMAEHRAAPDAGDGLVRCAVDPYVQALHRALLGRSRRLRADIRAFRDAILERALAGEPERLSAFERRVLLSDPDCLDELHRRAWALPPAALASWVADERG
jgi:membrane glycosyltransferase